MNFRRIILALFFLSLGHMVFGQAALAVISSETKAVSRADTEDPCADEEKEADCPDEEAFSQAPSNKDGVAPMATLHSTSDCESNSCTGPECFIRGSCGGAAVHLGNKVTISSPEPVALYFDFVPQAAQGPDPLQPIKPPIS
jgi:hypothetical protein